MSKYKDKDMAVYGTLTEAREAFCTHRNCTDCPLSCENLVKTHVELAAELMGLEIIQQAPEPGHTANPTEEAPEETVIEEPVTYKVGEQEETYMENRVISGKVLAHWRICEELNRLYERKNHDYGDSFHQSFAEEGMAMARIRLGDKLSRFKALTRNGGQQVTDESIRDTLIDLANYAIMTVMEMEEQQ